jgi:hypothetical protein
MPERVQPQGALQHRDFLTWFVLPAMVDCEPNDIMLRFRSIFQALSLAKWVRKAAVILTVLPAIAAPPGVGSRCGA